MGRTFVDASIEGPSAAKEYSFLVDTGASFVGLPIGEIQELGLIPIPDGNMQFLTASGVMELPTYAAMGHLQEQGFVTTIVPAPRPILGYEFLENHRLRVNPVRGELERVPDDVEDHPPYLLLLGFAKANKSGGCVA